MKRFVGPSLLVVLVGSLLVQLPMAIADRTNSYTFFDPIVEVFGVLNDDFVTSIDPDTRDQMQRRMIDAAIDVLDDPYTTYVPPANTSDFNKAVRGEYVGIGAEVNVINNYLTIVTPIDHSPALEAGLRAGDVVLEIEGESTFQLDINECIERLMGKPNTDVNVRVRHDDDTEQDLVITRRQIVTPTVKGVRRNGEDWNYCVDADFGIGYLRVTQFNANTVEEMQTALRGIQNTGLNGLILDLRDNPGGALNAAVGMADLFLDDGRIVTVRPRQGGEQSWDARADGTLPFFPMVVLINDSSASASEIVAGALQENGRAKVLGMRSFGKGSVQEIRPLRFGQGTLKITTADYLLPSGRNLNRYRTDDASIWGVDPDPGMVLTMTDDERLDMFRARRDFEIIRAASDDAAECADVAWVRSTLLDEQLAQAIEALQVRLDGDWPQISEDDAESATYAIELDRQIERRKQLLEALAQVDGRIDELATGENAIESLLPEDADLTDGTIVVRDKYGNVIGEYRIEGGDVAVALNAIDVEKVDN